MTACAVYMARMGRNPLKHQMIAGFQCIGQRNDLIGSHAKSVKAAVYNNRILYGNTLFSCLLLNGLSRIFPVDADDEIALLRQGDNPVDRHVRRHRISIHDVLDACCAQGFRFVQRTAQKSRAAVLLLCVLTIGQICFPCAAAKSAYFFRLCSI